VNDAAPARPEPSPSSREPSPSPERVRIWDGPTRLFHWLLVLLIPALWWTARYDRIEWHVTLGVATAGLLLFRIIWGLIGSSTARFSHFLKGPRGILSYLNGRAAHALGHNPLGGWSVAAMLALLAAQVGLGLFAEDDDAMAAGPFAIWLEPDTSEWLTELHGTMFYVLLALIALHVAAILVYALRRRNLVGPMITGRGKAPQGTAPMRAAPAWRAALALLASAAIALWLWSRL
jgi:cytochrome b